MDLNCSQYKYNYRACRAFIADTIAPFSPWFIGLAETKLKPSHTNPFVLPGYGLMRHDRSLSRGGGVALLFREDIIMSIVRLSTERVFGIPRESEAEFLAVNALHPRFGSILVIIVYRSLRTSHFDDSFAEIEDLLFAPIVC